MKNKVVFTPLKYGSSTIVEKISPPVSAVTEIPDWFRAIPRYHYGAKEMKVEGMWHNLTVRHCMPFLDAFSSGYLMKTWTDILITREKGALEVRFGDDSPSTLIPPQLHYQEYFEAHVPAPLGYTRFQFAWQTYWRIKTPEGVSSLFTHPLNRTDLPFITLSGVTDTDKWGGSDVLNVAIKDDFEGVIPAGTPYVQIIPFYRNEWEADVKNEPDLIMEAEREAVMQRRQNLTSGHYRDAIHTVKRF